MKKQYPGHAKRVMMGVWSFLRQFMYTKYVIVCDEDVDARDWHSVVQAMTTRMDPVRDTLMIEHTPIDSLDFASPVVGLGSKMGWDVTKKWDAELAGYTSSPARISDDADVQTRVAALKSAHPQLVDIYLPPEAHAHGMVMATINKQAVGDGPRVIEAIWQHWVKSPM